jgi:hypothetical protein
MSVPDKLNLPSASPFFGKETGALAAQRLRKLYVDKISAKSAPAPQAKLAKALTALIENKKQDRAPMGIGMAVLPAKGDPYFVGSNDQRLYSVFSIAKLALLYAAFQLRADVAVIGNTDGLAVASPDYKVRVDDLVNAVQEAFKRSNDSELQRLGNSDQDFPKLARIFNLQDYLKADPPNRSTSSLQFEMRSYTPANTRETFSDSTGFNIRLHEAVPSSDNPNVASCVCDIGLPYIQALLQRSGFGSLHGSTNRPGLWLSSFYQSSTVVNNISQKRKGSRPDELPDWLRDLPVIQRDAITTAGPLRMTDYNVERHTSGTNSGHVATAVGMATFLTELYAGRLVDAAASAEMFAYLPKSRWIADKLRGLGEGTWYSKVGFSPPHFCDCALVKAQNIEAAATSKPQGSSGGGQPDGGSSSGSGTKPITTWIAVGLDALGSKTEEKDNGILEDLGKDLETAIADSVE